MPSCGDECRRRICLASSKPHFSNVRLEISVWILWTWFVHWMTSAYEIWNSYYRRFYRRQAFFSDAEKLVTSRSASSPFLSASCTVWSRQVFFFFFYSLQRILRSSSQIRSWSLPAFSSGWEHPPLLTFQAPLISNELGYFSVTSVSLANSIFNHRL